MLVGMCWWKEFVVGGVWIEMCLIVRIGEGLNDFVFVSYQWNEGESEVQCVPFGVIDVNNTMHDILSEDVCRCCYGLHEKFGGCSS